MREMLVMIAVLLGSGGRHAPECTVRADRKVLIAISIEDQQCVAACENAESDPKRALNLCTNKSTLNVFRVDIVESDPDTGKRRLRPLSGGESWLCGTSGVQLKADYEGEVNIGVEKGYTDASLEVRKSDRVRCVPLTPEAD